MNRDYGFDASWLDGSARVCCRPRDRSSRGCSLLARPTPAYVLWQRKTERTHDLFTKKTNTHVGELTLIASEGGLAAILWEGDDQKRVRLERQREDNDNDILVETERQLKSYFDGTLKVFSVPLDFVGTEFQTRVWKALLKNSVRSDPDLHSDRQADRTSDGSPRGGCRQRQEPDLHHGALPSRGRCKRRFDGLRRRSRYQGAPALTGA